MILLVFSCNLFHFTLWDKSVDISALLSLFPMAVDFVLHLSIQLKDMHRGSVFSLLLKTVLPQHSCTAFLVHVCGVGSAHMFRGGTPELGGWVYTSLVARAASYSYVQLCHLFPDYSSKWLYQFTFSPDGPKRSWLPTSSPTLGIVRCLTFVHLMSKTHSSKTHSSN